MKTLGLDTSRKWINKVTYETLDRMGCIVVLVTSYCRTQVCCWFVAAFICHVAAWNDKFIAYSKLCIFRKTVVNSYIAYIYFVEFSNSCKSLTLCHSVF